MNNKSVLYCNNIRQYWIQDKQKYHKIKSKDQIYTDEVTDHVFVASSFCDTLIKDNLSEKEAENLYIILTKLNNRS